MPDHAAVRLVADTRLRGLAGPQPARTYWPVASRPAPLLVFLPAGGIDAADALCRAVCSRAGVVVLCVSYRRPASPDGRCDAVLAAGWAAEHARELGADPDRLLVAGDGTGAGLAAAVVAWARERGWPRLTHLSLEELHDLQQKGNTMSTVLVTGGLGMIGAHTARALTDLGHEVVVTAHHRADVPAFLEGRVAVEALDVTDRDAFLALGRRYAISDIVHLAGSIPADDPVGFFRTDTTGLLNALDAARTWQVRRFAVASSVTVYTGQTEVPWHEELPLHTVELPHLIVAFKKAVEPLTTHALRGSGVQPVVLRIGSIWGPVMNPESPFNPIPPHVSALLRGDEPAPLPAGPGGDWCYAPDAGRAIALLTTTPTLRHDTYNVSSGTPYTNRQLAAALGADLPDEQPAGPHMDISRLTADTGFTPDYDLDQAVKHYLAWRADNPR